ncbi:uncharacterized protein LOC106667835 isoform X2 [Cimex lectularius]|uniref:Uncharacterized protein n=1 Tax=Cimex lectularius TaxID=79782 RepID=A0A8I6SJA6_CIMLE|nr:uncharacterized protein LOC106667835 isoform X2 [Cimex lectularius]
MQLQTAIYQTEFHHRELQAEYDFCKRSFERLADFDWAYTGTGGRVHSHISKALSAFWRKIDKKTRAYTNVLDLLEKKAELETTIKDLWKSHLNSRSRVSDEGIQCVSGFKEHAQMRLFINTLKLKWTRYNAMKYKFALEHVQEMNDKLRDIKYKTKKKSIFSIKGSGKIRKLQNDISWYKKNEKSLSKDVEKLEDALKVLAYKLDIGKQKWLYKALQQASKECGLKSLPVDFGDGVDKTCKGPVSLPSFFSGLRAKWAM